MQIDDILQDFLSEAEERFSLLETQLIALEKQPHDADALAAVFRGAHSLKGTCGFLGFSRLGRLAHAAEDLLSSLRNGTQEIQRFHVDLLLQALDIMRRVTAEIAKAQGESAETKPDEENMIRALLRFTAGHAPDISLRHEDTMQPSSLPTVRVGADVLDNLLALGGELALAHARLGQTAADTGVMRHMAQLLADMQTEISHARMQPVMEGWRNLPRIVRDMATSAGVQARLETQGGDAQLDRHVLDMVRDPVAHLVRNCLSHGIEPAADRRAAGKPEEGIIHITARTAEGRMLLSVSDDGRGLDFAAIRRCAEERKIASAAELADMDDAALAALLFQPGFSTTRQVDELSGRGVGLDVVMTQMALIGGTVDVQTRVHGGTIFTLSIPLTLAMIPAVVMWTGRTSVVLPRTSVAGFARLPKNIPHLKEQMYFIWQGRHIPLMSLEHDDTNAQMVTIISADGRYAGIRMEKVMSMPQVLVKPLPPLLPDRGRYLGVTILPDGASALILDARQWALRHGVEIAEKAAMPTTRCDAYLVFDMAGYRRALPVASVRQIMRVPTKNLHYSAQGEVFWPQGESLRPLYGAADARCKQQVFIIQTIAGGFVMCSEIEGIHAGPPAASDTSLLLGGRAAQILSVACFSQPPAGVRILLVDDSDFFCSLLTPFLQEAGYDVTSVPDAAHALALCEQGQSFELIISDIEMPEMNGLDFAKRIKQNGSAWQRTPLVGLSAHATKHDEKRGRAAGFDDFITKFDRIGLLQKVAELCRRS